MIIIDDFIPLEEQEILKKHILGNNFPWFFVSNITNEDDTDNLIPAFSHVFKHKGQVNSSMYEMIEFIGKKGAEQFDSNYNNVFQVRSFFQLPSNNNDTNPSHIDLEEPHVVVLYYVTDSDGDTILYNKKYEGQIVDMSDVEIVQRVTPKQGRVLIFDGYTYHSSSRPKDNLRCVINFDVIK